MESVELHSFRDSRHVGAARFSRKKRFWHDFAQVSAYLGFSHMDSYSAHL